MFIAQKNNWLGRKMESLNTSELSAIFEEVAKYRKTGILKSGKLRKLEADFSDNVSHTPYGECMRLVEDAVLFEMSRRFYNENEKVSE